MTASGLSMNVRIMMRNNGQSVNLCKFQLQYTSKYINQYIYIYITYQNKLQEARTWMHKHAKHSLPAFLPSIGKALHALRVNGCSSDRVLT